MENGGLVPIETLRDQYGSFPVDFWPYHQLHHFFSIHGHSIWAMSYLTQFERLCKAKDPFAHMISELYEMLIQLPPMWNQHTFGNGNLTSNKIFMRSSCCTYTSWPTLALLTLKHKRIITTDTMVQCAYCSGTNLSFDFGLLMKRLQSMRHVPPCVVGVTHN